MTETQLNTSTFAGLRPSAIGAVPAAKAVVAPGGSSHIVAVGGGKGGLGKSFVTSSLGIALAKRGQSVVMVDAELGGANLHVALGEPPPKVSLSDLLSRRVKHIEDVRADTDIPNLSLVSGAGDYLMAANVNYQQKNRLLRQIRLLQADFILLDVGAGTAWNVVDFFLLADRGIVFVAPEPAAIQTVFRFVKTCVYRRLQGVTQSTSARELLRQAMHEKNDGNIATLPDLIAAVKEYDLEAGQDLEEALRSFRPWLMVNHVRVAEDKRLGPTMAGICFNHLGIDMDCLSPIYFDDRVWQANRSGKPYLLAEPNAPAAKNLDGAAGRLVLQRHSTQPLALGAR